MKYMSWNEEDLYLARPEIVQEIIKIINEEQEYLESLNPG